MALKTRGLPVTRLCSARLLIVHCMRDSSNLRGDLRVCANVALLTWACPTQSCSNKQNEVELLIHSMLIFDMLMATVSLAPIAPCLAGYRDIWRVTNTTTTPDQTPLGVRNGPTWTMNSYWTFDSEGWSFRLYHAVYEPRLEVYFYFYIESINIESIRTV